MNNAKTKTANLTRADICTKKYSNDKKIIVSLVLTAYITSLSKTCRLSCNVMENTLHKKKNFS